MILATFGGSLLSGFIGGHNCFDFTFGKSPLSGGRVKGLALCEESQHFSKLLSLPRRQTRELNRHSWSAVTTIFTLFPTWRTRPYFEVTLDVVFTLGNCLKRRNNAVTFVSAFLHLGLCLLIFLLFINPICYFAFEMCCPESASLADYF